MENKSRDCPFTQPRAELVGLLKYVQGLLGFWERELRSVAGDRISEVRLTIVPSVREWAVNITIVQLHGLDKMKIFNCRIGTQTRDLPACSLAPQPSPLPRETLKCSLDSKSHGGLSLFVTTLQ
jgi:hypothetical protein